MPLTVEDGLEVNSHRAQIVAREQTKPHELGLFKKQILGPDSYAKGGYRGSFESES
jgi:hypothetical protein